MALVVKALAADPGFEFIPATVGSAITSAHTDVVSCFQCCVLCDISFPPANCGDPTVPTNGSIYGTYQNATEGTEIVFRCNAGFFPTENITAVCQADGRWNPATVMCTCT